MALHTRFNRFILTIKDQINLFLLYAKGSSKEIRQENEDKTLKE